MSNIPEGISVLVDGGCYNNNRPVTERDMYGSLTVYNNGAQVDSTYPEVGKQKIHTFHFGNDEYSSNNLAELLVMENALHYILQLRERHIITSVTVMTDSQFAIGYTSGEFKPGKKASKGLLEARSHLGALMNDLKLAGVTVKFQHVGNQWVKSVLGH